MAVLRAILAATLTLAALGPAAAQVTSSGVPKPFEANTVLKDGRKIEVREPSFVGDKLCGWIFEEGAAPAAMPKSDCIARQDIASTQVSNPRRDAVREATDGALCIILAPICLAKVKAAQERIVDRAAEKAKAAPATAPTPGQP
jgi:hypothetical protein